MWPNSGPWETRISGVTTIKKAWADAIDAALNGIYGGTSTVVSLSSDGVGDQASTAAPGDLQFTGKLNNPTGQASGHRTLVAEFSVGAGLASHIRIYVEGDWIFEVVVNAMWDDVGLIWTREHAGYDASHLRLTAGAFLISGSPGAGGPATWADTAWTNPSAISVDTDHFGGPQVKTASDGGVAIQDGSNAMVVGSAGVAGPGTILFMVAGGGESDSPGWPLFLSGDYRKSFPATPGIIDWDTTVGQNNVVDGATGVGYSMISSDQFGTVWIATALAGATGTWAQLEVEAS